MKILDAYMSCAEKDDIVGRTFSCIIHIDDELTYDVFLFCRLEIVCWFCDCFCSDQVMLNVGNILHCKGGISCLQQLYFLLPGAPLGRTASDGWLG